MILIFFFFFQAEDGIRDYKVTGVQTCALPIFIKGFNSRGVVAVAGKNREITHEDVRRAIDAAKAVSLPTGREILHVLPQDFVVDEQDGIGAPVGMTGARLEVNVHIVTGSQSSTQNLVACVNRAGATVAEAVVEQLAASESVLTS